MSKKKTFAYIGTPKIPLNSVAVEAIKCGLSVVGQSDCAHQWTGSLRVKWCSKCGVSKHDYPDLGA